MYTRSAYDALKENTEPEILRCNLSGTILNLKAMGINQVSQLDFIDKPSQTSFLAAFKILIALGAVDAISANLTKLGREMSVLPTEPVYSKLLVTSLKADYVGISGHIAAIVAMLSVENIFFAGQKDEQRIVKQRRKLLHKGSDHLTLLKIFVQYEKIAHKRGEARHFCNEHGLNERSISKAMQIRQQLLDYMRQIVEKRESK